MNWRNKKRSDFQVDRKYIAELSTEEAKLYMELAEKQVQDSIDTGSLIADRAASFLALASGIFIALVAFSINRWEAGNRQQVDQLLSASLLGSFVLLIVCILLLLVIFPKNYCICGASPGKFLNDTHFASSFNTDARQKNACINQIENYQNSLVENSERNSERSVIYKIAVAILLISPMLFASYYLFVR